MNKLLVILLSATLLSSQSFADSDNVLATLKGKEIKESEIMGHFKEMLNSQPNFKDKKFSDLDKQMQEALVKAYANGKMIELESKDSGIESSAEFQAKITEVKNQLLQQHVIDKHIKTAITDSMIDAEYNNLVSSLKGKDEFKASHILFDDEAKAKEAKKKLSKGSKFGDVVKEFSKDQSTKSNGGSLGYFMEGQLVPEFEQKVATMKIGEISDPVKTQFGWHIIKLDDKRKVKVPTKDEAKNGILSKLHRDAIEKFLDDLSKKYDLKINL